MIMTSSVTGPRRSLVLLDASQDVEVHVKALDKDQFFMTAREAVQACQAQSKQLEFVEQFQDLCSQLGNWVKLHGDKIAMAVVTVRKTDILLFVKQNKVEYDDELASALTALDIEVANSDHYNLIPFNVMSVPYVSADSTSAFLSSGMRVDV